MNDANTNARTIYLIVEGHGDFYAAPKLVLRILQEHYQRYEFQRIQARQASGHGNITTIGGLERFLELIRRQKDAVGLIVLLDAERENLTCPPGFAQTLARRTHTLGLPFPTVIVCAVCEYECWFLHNLAAISPKYHLTTAIFSGDPEQECSAKGWIDRHLPPNQKYQETEHQAKMTFDINIPHTIEKSRSFRRLVEAIGELLDAIDSGKTIVTPLAEGDS